MKTTTLRTMIPLLLLAVAAVWPADAIAQAEGEIRVYQPRFLRNSAAMALALQVCGDDMQRCEVEPMDGSSFLLRGPAAAHAELGALLHERDVPPPTQEFRVILLAADDSGTTPDLPDGARQAVQDIAAVLRYTGFSVIDSGWMRTSGRASTSLGEAGSFDVWLQFEGDPRSDSALLVEFNLDHSQIVWRSEAGDDDNPIPRVGLEDPVNVLRSQFGINVGETVVVGTSRINGGNQALVVLLTAIDR